MYSTAEYFMSNAKDSKIFSSIEHLECLISNLLFKFKEKL